MWSPQDGMTLDVEFLWDLDVRQCLHGHDSLKKG
jgi:hypothetical protein